MSEENTVQPRRKWRLRWLVALAAGVVAFSLTLWVVEQNFIVTGNSTAQTIRVAFFGLVLDENLGDRDFEIVFDHWHRTYLTTIFLTAFLQGLLTGYLVNLLWRLMCQPRRRDAE